MRVVKKGKTGVYYFFHLRIVESSAAQVLLFSMARAIVNLNSAFEALYNPVIRYVLNRN